jgi:cell wall-associated NlpC family hydrolase
MTTPPSLPSQQALDLSELAVAYTAPVRSAYLYGGYTPTAWDCSGMVGWLLAVEFGLVLPGEFAPIVEKTFVWNPDLGYHPPGANGYLVWRTAETIEQSAAMAGDLYVWETHVGIALDPYFMVSALDDLYGTAVTPVEGFAPPGETMVTRRIKPFYGIS